MKKLIFSSIICLFVINLALISHAITAREIIEKTMETYSNIPVVSAELKQTQFIPNVKKETVSKGKIYLSHPNKFRIEYEQPEEQIVVCDGDTIWVYNAPNNQVILQSAKGSDDLIFNHFKDSNSQLISEVELLRTKTYLIELTPKDSTEDVKNIRAWIDKNLWLPIQVEITDLNGNRVTYTLIDIEQKDKIRKGLFQFEIPTDAEVFQQ